MLLDRWSPFKLCQTKKRYIKIHETLFNVNDCCSKSTQMLIKIFEILANAKRCLNSYQMLGNYENQIKCCYINKII